MEFLVRQYVSNRDKTNTRVYTIEDAVKILKKELTEVETVISWSNYVDLYFKGTNNYIRIIN